MTSQETTESESRKEKAEATMGKISNWYLLIIIGTFVLLISGLMFFVKPALVASSVEITVYKSSACKCCDKWVEHLRDAGFIVTAENSSNMRSIKLSTGVKPELQSCHTALVEGYVIEGHVPASDIKRLLKERPDVSGLTVPGMPKGSPGMEGPYKEHYEVLTFDQNGQTKVYARY